MSEHIPPVRGCWVLADCRWSYHGLDDLLSVVTDLLGLGHSVVLVPDSRANAMGLYEAGGIAAPFVTD